MKRILEFHFQIAYKFIKNMPRRYIWQAGHLNKQGIRHMPLAKIQPGSLWLTIVLERLIKHNDMSGYLAQAKLCLF